MLDSIAMFLCLLSGGARKCLDTSQNSPGLTTGMKWDYPLGYEMTAEKANASVPFYSVDLWNTTADDIKSMQESGHFISCYFSAGSREDWRDDADKFPKDVTGNPMKDWPGENWIDVRSDAVRQIMTDRISLASQKACNGIDPDNIDGYLPDNNAGFPLTADDAVDFVKFLCKTANDKGLRCGLKNGVDLSDRLVGTVDWSINEECVAQDECDQLQPFVDAKKPVFHVEYSDTTDVSDDDRQKFCAPAGFSSIIKNKDLHEWTLFCT